MGGIFIFIVFIGIAALFIVVAIHSSKKAQENWQAAARELKLHYYPGSFLTPGIIKGKYHGHKIQVNTYTRSSGKNSQTYTRFTVYYSSPAKLQFNLSQQNFLHSLGKMFGMKDIEIGDPLFDNRVLVKGQNHAQIVKFLTPNKRAIIRKIITGFSFVEITNSHLTVSKRGRIGNRWTLTSHIKQLAHLADAFSKKRKKSHPLEKAGAARAEGDIHKAVKIIKTSTFDDNDDKLEAHELEGELLYIADRKKDAGKAFEKVTKEVPDDHHAKQWARITEKASDIQSQKNEKIISDKSLLSDLSDNKPPETAESRESDQITFENICNTLFRKNLMSFEAADIFTEEYKDKIITSEGKVVSNYDFSFDLVFRNTSGIKTTLEIMEIKSDFGTAKIKAVACFPEKELEKLKKFTGKKVKFTGKLLSVDTLMKNIFISDANLL